MITNVNITRCDNGWLVGYEFDGKSRRRVFLTWESLCNWLFTNNKEA